MGSFDEHMSAAPGGILALFVGVIAFVSSGWVVGASAAIGAYLITHIGAAFPDIDHHSSIPYRNLRKILTYSVGIAMVWFFSEPILNMITEFWSNSISAVEQIGFAPGAGQGYIGLIFLVCGSVFFIMKMFGVALDELQPKHRGITHEKGTGLVVSAAVAYVVFYPLQSLMAQDTAILLGILMGLSSYLGILSHLRLDEMIK